MSRDDLLTRAVTNVIPRDLAERKLQSKKKLRVYWGIDPTSSRMHLGHTVPMRKLRDFANAGHDSILLIGSFTAMIGDPSGRDVQRRALTREEVNKNFETYKKQASKILDFSKVEEHYNHEWLEKIIFENIVQLARHFTVQQMSERAMFVERMHKGKPVFVHEFLYPIMVGYDSVILDVDCELGGTDQEFNMLAGRTLQKVCGKREKFVLTVPLIEGTDGRKMSKSYENCIYLDDAPQEMYGKLMSIRDELITIYMECCTDIPMEEVLRTSRVMEGGSNPRESKARLAYEIVKMYHSSSQAQRAQEEFEQIFRKRDLPDNVPEIKVGKGSTLLDVLVHQGLAPSKSEARRLIKQGGVKLNDVVVQSVDAKVEKGILKVGKRKFLKVK